MSHIAEQLEQRTSTRPKFIKQLGVALAAGIGLAALKPSVARAANNCCPASYSPCVTCSGNQTDYYCDCSGSGLPGYCTGCRDNTGCFTGGC